MITLGLSMQKNDEVLPVIAIDENFVLKKEQFDILDTFTNLVFINTTGIFAKDIQQKVEKSFMDFGFDPARVKEMFFVHMNRVVFERLKADTLDKKFDFASWHFFYDIFKVPKYGFQKTNIKSLAIIPEKEILNLLSHIELYEKQEDKYLLVDNKSISSGCVFERMAFEKMQIDSFQELEEAAK